MGRRDVTLTPDLERPEPGEPRELTAERQNVQQLRHELKDAHDRLAEQGRRLREQRKLLRAMLGSRAFAIAEQLSRLRGRGRPVFSRQQVRRALGDEDGPRSSASKPSNTPLPGMKGRERRFPVPLPGMKGREIGEDFLRFFVDFVDLAPTEAVLEPGCGTGRIAEPLTHYLTTGSYDGFDVVATAIEWCQRNIAHPNFRFRHVDVFNRHYNPEGQLDPETFEFPYPAGSFDFVFVASVFTHMLPPEVRHYLSEIRRVLRPTGRCVMTFFLLDEQGARIARDTPGPKRVFAYEGDGYRYDVAGDPEAAIGYGEREVLEFFEQARFELHAPIYYTQQDVVVVAPT